MIPSEVILKSIDLIPQEQIIQRDYIYIINYVTEQSNPVESSEYYLKTLLKGSRLLRLWTRPYGTLYSDSTILDLI